MNRTLFAIPCALLTLLACGGGVNVGGPQLDAAPDTADGAESSPSCVDKECGAPCGGDRLCSNGKCVLPHPSLCFPGLDAGEDAPADAGSFCADKKCGTSCGGGNVCSYGQCVAPNPGLCLPGNAADMCISTGGTIATSSCCNSASDFPNQCNTGACGCAPTSSHDIRVCQCAAGRCFLPGTGCQAQ